VISSPITPYERKEVIVLILKYVYNGEWSRRLLEKEGKQHRHGQMTFPSGDNTQVGNTLPSHGPYISGGPIRTPLSDFNKRDQQPLPRDVIHSRADKVFKGVKPE